MSKNISTFPLAMIDNIKAHPENYRLLERIPLTILGVDTHFPIKLNDPVEGERVHSVVFLDTETTGRDYRSDKVIELGLVKATFSFDRKILLTIDRYYDEFEDPQTPIPDEIVKLTGISDDMVKGKHFDDEMVAKFLSGRPLVIAHNAAFDRPFFEKRFTTLNNLSWACSLKEVPWQELGFPGAKLEYLNTHLGYFYDAHRAYVDCLALLWLMYQCPQAFNHLIDNCLKSSYKMVVKGYTFKINNRLKDLGFRFDGTAKVWSKFVYSKEDCDRCKSTLESYIDGEIQFEIDITTLSAKTRYKGFE